MVNLETFLLGLMIISTFTGLVTEAIKKILAEHNIAYKANTLAGIVSAVLSAAVGICYAVVTNTAFTASFVVCVIALVFMSWLCSMVGYDKVIDIFSPIKKKEE